MNSSTVALIILVISIFCFVTEVIPLPITAVGSAIAMSIFGVIPYSAAFAGFANDVTMMVIGAIIIGETLFETGLAQELGTVMLKAVGKNEKLFLITCVLVSAILSAFLSNTAVVAMMLPVVAATAVTSHGRITKKNTYMAIGFAANVGGGMTLVGSTPNVIGQGLLIEAGLPGMGFFDLTLGSLPRLIFMVLFYTTFGYALQKKVFDFEESVPETIPDPIPDKREEKPKDRRKMWISGLILVATVAGFVTQIWTVGTIAMLAGVLCVVTRCIDVKTLFVRMDWTTVWVLAGALGMAAGISESGAGELIANTVVGWFGGSVSLFTLMIIFTVIAILMGNFMSSSATIAILGPIAIYMCEKLGFDAKVLMMVIIWSINLAFLTPIGTAPVTMTLQGGYRFSDYVKVGGVLLIGCTVISILTYPFIFHLF